MADLYETDTVAWAGQQAALLRRVAAGERPNTVPDWSNIAAETDSMGKSQPRELASRTAGVIAHLMKPEASPAREPRAALLADAPSLRTRVAAIIEATIEASIGRAKGRSGGDARRQWRGATAGDRGDRLRRSAGAWRLVAMKRRAACVHTHPSFARTYATPGACRGEKQ